MQLIVGARDKFESVTTLTYIGLVRLKVRHTYFCGTVVCTLIYMRSPWTSARGELIIDHTLLRNQFMDAP